MYLCNHATDCFGQSCSIFANLKYSFKYSFINIQWGHAEFKKAELLLWFMFSKEHQNLEAQTVIWLLKQISF